MPRVGPVCPTHTHQTLTLSGMTVSSARGPSPSSGWDVTGGGGPREPGAVARRSLSSREYSLWCLECDHTGG